MANVAKCPDGVEHQYWKDYQRMTPRSRALFCHGSLDEYVHLRKIGKTLGLNKCNDIVKALVDLYHEDYADRFGDDV